MGRELKSRWLVEGTCWACHRLNRDDTLAELGECMDRPLALQLVEEEDLATEQ
jgi:hypothetical protein